MTAETSLRFSIRKHLPILLQDENTECGLACLVMIAIYYGHKVDLFSMRARFPSSVRGTNLKQLITIANRLTLDTRAVRLELTDLSVIAKPCILHWNMDHFVVLKEMKRGRYILHDPGVGLRSVDIATMASSFTGIALEVRPAQHFLQQENEMRPTISMILGKISGWRRAALTVVSFALFLECVSLLLPLALEWVVDNVLLSNDRRALVIVCCGLFASVSLQALFTLAKAWTTLYASTTFKTQWLANLFSHLLALPIDFFEKRSIGAISSRFDSVQSIQRTLSASFLDGFLDSGIALVIGIVLCVYSPTLGAIAISGLILYAATRFGLYHLTREAAELYLSHSGKQQSSFVETLRGIRAIKLYGREAERRSRWLNYVVEAANAQLKTEKLAGVAKASHVFLIGVQTILVLYLGSIKVMNGTLSLGMLIAFIAFKEQFNLRVSNLVDRSFDLRLLSVQIQRLADIVLTSPEAGVVKRRSPRSGDAIELQNVFFRYSESDPWLLENVSVTIRTGECVALVGASGAGKSTVIKLVAGLIKPVSGEILLRGGSTEYPEAVRQERISFVLQEDTLFSGTIGDNIHFFDRTPDQKRVYESARAACIDEEINNLPLGYNTVIGDMGDGLSGGQRQRILLARALYQEPDILILDEATSHLDVSTERRIAESLNKLKITRVIIAHRPETIGIADRVLVCERGLIVENYQNAKTKDIAI